MQQIPSFQGMINKHSLMVRELYKQANYEIRLYNQTKNSTYLLQAGEKCYNIVIQIVNLWMFEHGKHIIRSHNEMRSFYMTTGIRADTRKKLKYYGDQLHINFY